MSIDYRRLVQGLGQAAQMAAGTAGGLAAVDVVMTAAQEATGAAGATFIAYVDDRARVVVAHGEMAWFTPSVTYAEAKKLAAAEARKRGSVDVFVGS